MTRRKADLYEVNTKAKTSEEAIRQSVFQVGAAAIISGVRVHSNSEGWVVIPEFSVVEILPIPPKKITPLNSSIINRIIKERGNKNDNGHT